MSDSILNMLRQEHREVKKTLELIEGCQDVVRKKELYLQLKDELIPHMEGEEQTIYAHLIEDVHDEEAEEVAQQSGHEHQEIKNLLTKLDNIGIESDEWESTFRKLRKNVEMHVEQEESALFAEAKEDFSKEELMEFAHEFEDVKNHLNAS